MPGKRHDALPALLARLDEAAPGAVWLAASMHRKGDDRRRLARLKAIAAATRTPLLATNDVLYDAIEQRDLQDLLTCIREGVTIEQAGRLLEANAERHLKPGRRWRGFSAMRPSAIAETRHLLGRIDLRPGRAQIRISRRAGAAGLVRRAGLRNWSGGSQMRYPDGVPEKVQALLDQGTRADRELEYARYFLTVTTSSLRRSQGILCQGRGSAANSAVCYVLGITSVDPPRSTCSSSASSPRNARAARYRRRFRA
jgi:error-prone DNA polymerase